jgi:hypothetical protein
VHRGHLIHDHGARDFDDVHDPPCDDGADDYDHHRDSYHHNVGVAR